MKCPECKEETDEKLNWSNDKIKTTAWCVNCVKGLKPKHI